MQKGRFPFTEKLPESTESFRFLSHTARMLGEFNSRKDSQSTKLEQRPRHTTASIQKINEKS